MKVDVVLSPSRAGKYGKCGYEYKLHYIDKVPEIPSVALLGGSAFHDWAEDHERYKLGHDVVVSPPEVYFAERINLAELESGVRREEFKRSGRVTNTHPDKESIEVWREEILPMMVATYLDYDWGDWQVATDLPPDSTGKTYGLEYRVAVPGFQGYVDRIDVDKLGNLRFVDYKTGQRVYPSIQLQLYMVAGQIMGMRSFYAAYYNARKGTLDQTMCKWTQLMFHEYNEVISIGIKSELYVPNPGDHCGYCSVADHCSFKP